MISFEPTFLGQESIPLVWQIVKGQAAGIDAVVDWFREQRPAMTAARDQYGALLIRGFRALDSAERFSAVLEATAVGLMNYVGGSAPRDVVVGHVTTASGLPGTHSLALHQEMAYQESRPDALMLFCEVPPEEAGETPIADARVVTRRLDPRVRARFAAKGVGIRRALPSPAAGRPNTVPRPWSQVFGTADREEVARLAGQRGWRIDWRPDDSMHLWQRVLPAFKAHARTGERVWANQVHYHAPECILRWALRDGRLADADRIREHIAAASDTLDQCVHSDGLPVSAEDAEHVWDVLEQSEVPLTWHRGDVLLLDNVLAMHGRRQFRGPRRILVGLMLDGRLPDEAATWTN